MSCNIVIFTQPRCGQHGALSACPTRSGLQAGWRIGHTRATYLAIAGCQSFDSLAHEPQDHKHDIVLRANHFCLHLLQLSLNHSQRLIHSLSSGFCISISVRAAGVHYIHMSIPHPCYFTSPFVKNRVCAPLHNLCTHTRGSYFKKPFKSPLSSPFHLLSTPYV